ncbi:T6SS immunity protein Tdi1 domain-containing protein [Massilia sp. 9096]|uniref:T6SS immunity protein Tdi1 domain-containing protein n=1 Tax=Massilia sp. 9096 TaxID=1500894 RepID=UPI0027D84105|nr:T6SS immunity protein Tdi1 domain-containing protein [Massilia sp. 9096]
MQPLDEVRNAWAWVGIEPVELIDANDFGNLILKDVRGQYWRLCPEDLCCEVVARCREELDRLSKDQDFLSDWYMRGLVDQAFQRLGALAPGRKYCLKIPGVLGGEYGGDNLGRYRSTNSSELPAILLSKLPIFRTGHRSSYPLPTDICTPSTAKVCNGSVPACRNRS